jgi:hypothetical protein
MATKSKPQLGNESSFVKFGKKSGKKTVNINAINDLVLERISLTMESGQDFNLLTDSLELTVQAETGTGNLKYTGKANQSATVFAGYSNFDAIRTILIFSNSGTKVLAEKRNQAKLAKALEKAKATSIRGILFIEPSNEVFQNENLMDWRTESEKLQSYLNKLAQQPRNISGSKAKITFDPRKRALVIGSSAQNLTISVVTGKKGEVEKTLFRAEITLRDLVASKAFGCSSLSTDKDLLVPLAAVILDLSKGMNDPIFAKINEICRTFPTHLMKTFSKVQKSEKMDPKVTYARGGLRSFMTNFPRLADEKCLGYEDIFEEFTQSLVVLSTNTSDFDDTKKQVLIRILTKLQDKASKALKNFPETLIKNAAQADSPEKGG